ncbi:hypothetical protein AQ490_02545 [Wenjunlia vitaminophila]|uniref:Uncharacterized protein n=1 Tax=Wenjunlia vitaminophila TaxID=76728 RepID=A0A0T6LZA9_WENVI|nr:hypothetical protein AQ490_02545 [Wenjunlia vitaminophila]
MRLVPLGWVAVRLASPGGGRVSLLPRGAAGVGLARVCRGGVAAGQVAVGRGEPLGMPLLVRVRRWAVCPLL